MERLLYFARELLAGRAPEQYYIIVGVVFTLGAIFWSEFLSKGVINAVIWLFRAGGKRGPVGTELATRMLAAAGDAGVPIDTTALDTDFRLAFGDIDYQPERGVLELTDDKAKRATFSSAGLIALEVGRALQYRRRFFLVYVERWLARPVNFAGFAWVWPSVGAVTLPLVAPAVFTPRITELSYAVSGGLLGLVLIYVLLKIPLELDAARRGAAALEEAGVFSLAEVLVIYFFLALILSVTIFTTLVIGLNIFRSTVRRN